MVAEYTTDTPNIEELRTIFSKLLEEVQCEKFIIVGHLLEHMFSLNVKNSNTTMNLLIYLYDNRLIDEEDIKHGYLIYFI